MARLLRLQNLWESRPINEYLALELGFLPKDALARADLLSFVYSIYEVGDAFGATSVHSTPELRKEYWLKTRETTLNSALTWHEKYLASRGGNGPFYAGDKVRAAWWNLVVISSQEAFADHAT